ncbi:MAG: J domain-containing protein [Chloroflexi bacterium]|nr:J domain-containing protein [Chloroflexota bacterium]
MRGSLSPSEDPYRTLQVEPSADLEAIKAAYRRLARLYHPDLNPRPEAAERMRAINQAYRLLSDPHQRAAYDARRYLLVPTGTVVVRTPTRPRARPVVTPAYEPPTALQRRVDRIVAVLGVLLLIGIGLYAAFVIPRAEPGDRRAPRPIATSEPTYPGASAHDVSLSIPDRLRTDVGLRSFPGVVIVPPSSLAPFKDLPIMRIDATSQGIARYAVYYGDVTTGVASISGLIGRGSFDAAAPHIPDCAPDATYCAGPGVGQSASGPPGLELFRTEHLVGENPAFATHRVCCNGVYWSLSWYEPATNMSYTIDLSRSVAMQFGSSNADDNVEAARAVGALAGQLVQLS